MEIIDDGVGILMCYPKTLPRTKLEPKIESDSHIQRRNTRTHPAKATQLAYESNTTPLPSMNSESVALFAATVNRQPSRSA